ncbi:MAG: hypothetical protein ACKO7W_02630 [Elainella sp.]
MGWGSQTLVNNVLETLFGPVQTWLGQHPVFFWLSSHPLWLLALILLLLFLFSGLLRAVAGLTEQLWLGLLKLPIWLVQGLWQSSLFLLRRAKSTPPSIPPLAAAPPDRLTQVLERLEALRQEQEALLKEMRELTQRPPG